MKIIIIANICFYVRVRRMFRLSFQVNVTCDIALGYNIDTWCKR